MCLTATCKVTSLYLHAFSYVDDIELRRNFQNIQVLNEDLNEQLYEPSMDA